MRDQCRHQTAFTCRTPRRRHGPTPNRLAPLSLHRRRDQPLRVPRVVGHLPRLRRALLHGLRRRESWGLPRRACRQRRPGHRARRLFGRRYTGSGLTVCAGQAARYNFRFRILLGLGHMNEYVFHVQVTCYPLVAQISLATLTEGEGGGAVIGLNSAFAPCRIGANGMPTAPKARQVGAKSQTHE